MLQAGTNNYKELIGSTTRLRDGVRRSMVAGSETEENLLIDDAFVEDY
jgi:hypothetical protein